MSRSPLRLAAWRKLLFLFAESSRKIRLRIYKVKKWSCELIFLIAAHVGQVGADNGVRPPGPKRQVVGDERVRAAMLADVPVGESPIGGSAQLPP